MALQTHTRNGQNMIEKKIKSKLEPRDTSRPLPIWCRGIMSGCVNCGGCV